MNFGQNIINTIKLLYSNERLKVSKYSETIYVNKGVVEGSLISLMLFDLYIDLYIDDQISYSTLAYTDDIAVVCETENNWTQIIEAVESWCKILLKRKKGGILLIKGKTNDEEGIPIVKSYKYLRINLKEKLDIKEDINRIKLKEYKNMFRTVNILASKTSYFYMYISRKVEWSIGYFALSTKKQISTIYKKFLRESWKECLNSQITQAQKD